jgi:hypothetical protein
MVKARSKRRYIPYKLRGPIDANTKYAGDGWFYINGGSIDVCNGQSKSVRITRRKLEAALALMDGL